MTTTLRIFIWALATLAMMLAGCSSTGKKKVQSASATESEPYDLRSEGEIPPTEDTAVNEEADVEEAPLVEESLVVEEAVAPVDTTTPPPLPTMIPGFRVQIFAAGAEDIAERAAMSAKDRLGIEAYVEPIDGMFKVRVGDCLTRGEAEGVLARCKETYYKDAWIVECPIRADRAGGVAP